MRAARSISNIASAGLLPLAALLCLFAVRVLAATAAPGAAVGLMDVRFGGDTTTTRVVLDLDAPVGARPAPVAAGPGRLAFDLPTLLSTGAMQGSGHGLVIDWSVHNDAHGSTLVLDTPPGASAVRRFLIPPGAGSTGWRYVIDVASAPTHAALTSLPAHDPSAPRLFAAAPRFAPSTGPMSTGSMSTGPMSTGPMSTGTLSAGTLDGDDSPPSRAAATRPAALAKATAPRGAKVIVIDAGHGGHDPGARSLVRNEKDITLAAALDLKARLEKIGRYKVVLTRDHDEFIPLEQRVQIARRAGADLFISLHADSAGTDPTPHGASVYTLSDNGEKRVNNVLGPHEWFSQSGARRNDPGVRQILLDLTQQSTRNRSSQFAGVLIDHIGDRVDLLPRTHRDAGYFVLLAPDVPAVLLEMGFITNPGDEMRLTNPDQREHLMRGVADAIDAYFNPGAILAAG